MGNENYKEVFVSEAREHLDNLNEAILNLEKEPTNSDFVNQVFRACHTLKGNSAMMGYQKFSNLAHKMESVLGKIRDNELTATQEVIDKLLEGADFLEEGLDKINENNSDDIEAENLVNQLLAIAENTNPQSSPQTTEKDSKIEPLVSLTPGQQEELKAEEEHGANAYRAIIVLNPDNALNSAKVQILMKKSESVISKTIYSNPSFEDIKAGKVDVAFEFVFTSRQTKEDVEKILTSVSDMSSFILNLDEKFNLPEELLSSNTQTPEAKETEQPKKEAVPAPEAQKANTEEKLKHFAKPIQSIKIDVKKLDNLVNMVGELLISNMRLKQIGKEIQTTNLDEVINNIDMLTSNIQEEVMQQRMVPVGQIFSRFPRLVRDLSTKENKKINLVIKGEEIELDRNILDEIGEPLVHMIRNSIDHGIEDTTDRVKSEKSEIGTVNLTARREKNVAVIEIKDDGKGIDPEVVKKSAIQKGIITETEANSLPDHKAIQLIFQPGLSTKEKVTSISGRGVGMDVVLTKIKKLGGSVKVESELGKGSTIALQLPLTLAIISSLLVKVKEEKYAVPLSNVIETIDLSKDKIKTIQNNEVIILRGEEVPIVRLDSFFNKEKEEKDVYQIVITEESDKKVGFIVDEIINQQPILIKNLHSMVHGVKGIAGGTILGDGKVCLILDISSIS